MTQDQFKTTLEEGLGPIWEKLEEIEGNYRKRERTLLLFSALSLLIAGLAVYFAINRGLALDDQQETNREILCASAHSTAVAPRGGPLAGESQRNYVDRLLSQRSTLLRVGQLRCTELPGFVSFSYLRGRALEEIEDIIERLAPKRLDSRANGIVVLPDDSLATGEPTSPPSVSSPPHGPVSESHPGGGADPSPMPPGEDGDEGGDGPVLPAPGPSPPSPPSSSPPSVPPPSSTPAPTTPEPAPESVLGPERGAVGEVLCGTQEDLDLSLTPRFCAE